MYFRGREKEEEKEEKEEEEKKKNKKKEEEEERVKRETERAPIQWFTPQMPTTAGVESWEFAPGLLCEQQGLKYTKCQLLPPREEPEPGMEIQLSYLSCESDTYTEHHPLATLLTCVSHVRDVSSARWVGPRACLLSLVDSDRTARKES